jgi:hypothetical protein
MNNFNKLLVDFKGRRYHCEVRRSQICTFPMLNGIELACDYVEMLSEDGTERLILRPYGLVTKGLPDSVVGIAHDLVLIEDN